MASSVKYRLPYPFSLAPPSTRRCWIVTSWSTTAIFSSTSNPSHSFIKGWPSASAIKMYSDPTSLSAVVLQSRTSGTGKPSSVRRYLMVAASLAVASPGGRTGSGSLTIALWPGALTLKTLFDAPSATNSSVTLSTSMLFAAAALSALESNLTVCWAAVFFSFQSHLPLPGEKTGRLVVMSAFSHFKNNL